MSSDGGPKYVQYPGNLSQETRSLLIDCAKLSWLAYSEPAVVEEQYKNRDKQDPEGAFEVLKRATEVPKFITCKGCDAQCYLLKYTPPKVDSLGDKPVMAIAARGTTSIMDWMCNARAYQTEFKDCAGRVMKDVEVHAGFYGQFMAIWGIVDVEVKKHLASGGQLLCCGHSLGSSCAAIAALNYGSQYPTQVWYVGVGTPRVGNAAFAKAFAKCVQTRIRLKNCSDPVVAIVPPLDYVHVGCEVHLGPADNYPEVPVLLDVGDHSVAAYVKNLETPETAKQVAPAATKNWLQRTMDMFTWKQTSQTSA